MQMFTRVRSLSSLPYLSPWFRLELAARGRETGVGVVEVDGSWFDSEPKSPLPPFGTEQEAATEEDGCDELLLMPILISSVVAAADTLLSLEWDFFDMWNDLRMLMLRIDSFRRKGPCFTSINDDELLDESVPPPPPPPPESVAVTKSRLGTSCCLSCLCRVECLWPIVVVKIVSANQIEFCLLIDETQEG